MAFLYSNNKIISLKKFKKTILFTIASKIVKYIVNQGVEKSVQWKLQEMIKILKDKLKDILCSWININLNILMVKN